MEGAAEPEPAATVSDGSEPAERRLEVQLKGLLSTTGVVRVMVFADEGTWKTVRLPCPRSAQAALPLCKVYKAPSPIDQIRVCLAV